MTRFLATPPRHRSPADTVGALLAHRGSAAPQLLEALGAVLDDLPSLLTFLRRTADDRCAAADVAARSYWHPNGFAKLVLHVGSAPEFRLRLHIWPGGHGGVGESNPHSHRWDFASAVIAGEGLAVTEYEEWDGGDPSYLRHRYERNAVVVGGAPSRSRLTPDGEIGLRQVAARQVCTFGRYATEISTVHTVHPLGTTLVATAVVQGPHRADSTEVYCVRGSGPDPAERQLDADEIRLLIAELLAVVDPRGGVRG